MKVKDLLEGMNNRAMVSISGGWRQRVYSAAFDAFYCGCRVVYDIMEDIMPLVKVQNMDKVLTMEYYMGFIQPYRDVERLRDFAA